VAGHSSHQIVPDGILDNAEIVLVIVSGGAEAAAPARPDRFPTAVAGKKVAPIEEESFDGPGGKWPRGCFAERVARDAQEAAAGLERGRPAKVGHRVLVAVEASWDSEPADTLDPASGWQFECAVDRPLRETSRSGRPRKNRG